MLCRRVMEQRPATIAQNELAQANQRKRWKQPAVAKREIPCSLATEQLREIFARSLHCALLLAERLLFHLLSPSALSHCVVSLLFLPHSTVYLSRPATQHRLQYNKFLNCLYYYYRLTNIEITAIIEQATSILILSATLSRQDEQEECIYLRNL